MTAHVAWIAWLLLFFPIELPYALRHKYAGTLTAHTRWAFCWNNDCKYGGWIGWLRNLTDTSAVKQRRLWKTRRYIFLTFWSALTLHFIAGLPAWPCLILTAIPFGLTFVLATLFERREA